MASVTTAAPKIPETYSRIPQIPEFSSRRPVIPVVQLPPGTVLRVPSRIEVLAEGAGVALVELAGTMVLVTEATGSGAAIPDLFPIQTLEALAAGSGGASAIVTRPEDIEVLAEALGVASVSIAGVLAPVATATGSASVGSYGIFAEAVGSGVATASITKQGLLTALATGTGIATADVVRPIASYSDSFTGANGALSSSWVQIGSYAPVINGNKAQAGTAGPNSTASVYAARWNVPLLTDRQRVSGTVITPTGTAALTIGGSVFLRGSSAGDCVELLATNTGLYIFTRTAANINSPTQRASNTSLSIPSGTVIRLEASGTNYAGYIGNNTTPSVLWDDTTSVVPLDGTRRYVGIVCIGQKNQLAQSSFGYAIDDWAATDF